MTATRSGAKSTRPDNQPFDFNLDTVEPDGTLEPFVIQWSGKRWTFRHMDDLDCWELIEAARDGEMSAVLGAFKMALGSDYQKFRDIRLPQYKLMPLFRAWQKHCGFDENGNRLGSD